MNFKLYFLSLIFFIFSPFGFVLAQNDVYNINLDKSTIAKGYTVEAFDSLKLSLVPGILNQATEVEIVKLDEEMPSPWNLKRISKIFQFEFKNKQAYDNHKPFYIQFAYNDFDNHYKQVYFYDKNYSAWRPLPTKDFPKEKFVRSLIHLPFARIAVFADEEKLTVGKASWYAYKGGDFTASPDFPKGSRLRVINIDNNKFIDVVVNDYGPERALHPDRVVDLDKVAFAKIANLGAGIINVRVEPLFIAGQQTYHEKSAKKKEEKTEKIAFSVPQISSKSAIVMDAKNNKILFQKNSTEVLPLASLTKLVAVRVFLDTRPSLDRVVAYQEKDELYNYKWCKKWESARLRVSDGETLTIQDLIYSSLVGSANNTIETLVRISPLGRKDFIEQMNKLVVSWGASSTHFVEPTGLSPDNKTTAYDYALIAKNVLNHPIIVKASTMHEYKFYTVNTKKFHRLKNTNKLLARNLFHIVGSKTGYLDEAGYCLMTRVSQSGKDIIAVLLGADTKSQSLNEMEKLIKYGLKN